MPSTSYVHRTASTNALGTNEFLNAMKEDYMPRWEHAVNEQVKALKLFPKRGHMLGGQYSLTNVMTAFPQHGGIGFHEGQTLPTPKVPTYANPVTFSRALATRARITGHAKRAARKGKSVVFAKPLQDLLDSSRREHILSKNRWLHLGVLGILGQVKSGTSVTQFTMENRNDRNASAASMFKLGSFYLHVGMAIDTILDDTGAPQPLDATEATAEHLITAIDLTGADPVITIANTAANPDFAATPDAGDLIVPYQARINSSLGGDGADFDSKMAHPNGFFNLLADVTIKDWVYSLRRATNPFLVTNIVTGATRGVIEPYSEHKLSLASDNAMTNPYNGGEEPDCILCEHSMRREHVISVAGDRRFDAVLGKRGWISQAFQAGNKLMPIVTDRNCPPGVMYGFPKSSLGLLQEAPIHMVDDGPRFVSDKDEHEFVFVESFNTVCRTIAATFRYEDVNYKVDGLAPAL